MCSHVDSFHNFLHLYIVILAVSGYTKVYIDLGAEHASNALRVQADMVFICTDRHLTGGYQRKQFLCCHAFLLSYDLKLRCDDAFTGSFHLCTIISHVKKSPFVSTSNVWFWKIHKKPAVATRMHYNSRLLIVGIIQIRLWVKTFTVYSQLASAGPPVFICWGLLSSMRLL